jgi:hypothetical protein
MSLPTPRAGTTVWTKTLLDQRRALVWWSFGLVLTVFMYAAFLAEHSGERRSVQ